MIEPIALSTSWNGPGADLAALLDQHRALGFRRLEAYAHFTPRELRELASVAKQKDMEIGSLHSPCPVPMTPSGERKLWTDGLASVAEAERTSAVDAIKATIDAAAEVGARAIVVHLGNSGVASRQRQIFDTIARTGRLSDEHRRLRDEVWAEREAAKGPHLDAALRSIRAIGEHADGTGVRIGVECRDGYHEIPSLDEFASVLDATAGLPVGYWHDAGHGAKLDYAGFLEHEDLLRRYSDRLVGMHVHDTLLARDHLAPGMGTTDFSMLARYLEPGTLKTLEMSSSVTANQISVGLEVLEQYEQFGVREGILIEI
ncbi:MAG TPA: TIM barrel protein [Chloroflexota bacterium]|nr:TIM barrel protein [Chloroflexota bacterium]